MKVIYFSTGFSWTVVPRLRRVF